VDYVSKSIFEVNCNALKDRFPEILKRLYKSDNFRFSFSPYENSHGWLDVKIRLKGKRPFLLYQGENPFVKATTLVENWTDTPCDLKFVIGIGMGYLPIAGLKKTDRKSRMVLIEPSTSLFMCTLHHIDLCPILTCKRVDIFVGDDINIAEIVGRYRDSIPLGKTHILIHPNYSNILGEKIDALKNDLSENIQIVRDNWFTTKKYGQKMFTNAVANLPSLFAGTPMKKLRGKFRGIPAVCVAAGPSLDSALDALKKINNKALLIACDSSVNVLLKAGIRPHVVVTADIFETNLEKLKPHMAQLRNAILIFGIESNPDNVRLYLGERRIGVTAYNKLLINWIDPQIDLQCQMPAMTSVSHLALFSALALEADPILLVGMDLACIQGKSHAYGSVFFHSLENTKRISIQGNNGSQVFTSPQFVADKHMIEKTITQSPARIFNTSLDGAYIKGVSIKSLSELRATDFSSDVNIDDVINDLDWQAAAKESYTGSILHELVDEFGEFKAESSHFRSELSHQIECMEEQPDADNSSKMRSRFDKKFIEFQKKYHGVIELIKEIMLADFEEFFRKEEALAAKCNNNCLAPGLNEFQLMIKKIDTYETGIRTILRLLNEGESYFDELQELTLEDPGLEGECDKHVEIARWFDEKGELWQAEREYTRCFEVDPKNVRAYIELTQVYLRANLWPAARELVQQTVNIFGNLPEIVRLKKEIDCGINGIMDKIKEEWTKGNINATRKLLNEYLMLRPDDPQATLLKKVVEELDNEFCSEWKSSIIKPNAQPTFKQRMNLAAGCIQRLELEQGIGILEGITADFPDTISSIREKIGDIRMLQKDYHSAVWNYEQILQLEPNALEIVTKINEAKKGSGIVN
jgi:hypothetical protein